MLKKNQRFWDNEMVRLALAVILSRIVVLLLGWIFYRMRVPEGTLHTFYEWLTQAGDVPHFLHLAEYGYSVGDEYQNLLVFYPLFPAVIRLFSYIFGNYYVAGLVVSNISAVAGACFLYKLIRLDYSKQVAGDTVLFFILYPFSLFLSYCYTEALFIMLCVMCAYFARRSRWFWCGVTGFLAAICRNQGVIMFGVAAYEYVVQAADLVHAQSSGSKIKAFFRNLSPKGLFLLLIPAGLGVYLLINKVLFGDFFQFMEFQAAAPWYNGADFFVNNLKQHLEQAQNYEGLAYIIYIPQVFLFFMAFALILVGIRKKVRTSYLLFIAAYTLVSYTSSWLISGPRYMLSCFLMFLPMALLAQNKIWRYTLIVLSSALFFFIYYLYIFGHAIM